MSINPQGLVLEMTCVLETPRELLFYALSEPAALVKWWGPSGFTTPEVELNLEVGGRYRFGMQPPDGDLFHLAGEFIEIDPPRRLAYTFRWEEPAPDDQETVVTLTLDLLRARVSISSMGSSPPRSDSRCIKADGQTAW